MIPESVNQDIMTAGGLKNYLKPLVEQRVASMFLLIDEACLNEARNISEQLQTIELIGLNINGVTENKPLIERLDNLDSTSEEYKLLLE